MVAKTLAALFITSAATPEVAQCLRQLANADHRVGGVLQKLVTRVVASADRHELPLPVPCGSPYRLGPTGDDHRNPDALDYRETD